jgi:flagellar biosynthesis GTPase FlhF
MKIRRFTAPTVSAAIKQVKAVLGADAVILETTEAGGQVTVTAAVDPDTMAGGDGELVLEVRRLLAVVHELVAAHRAGTRVEPASEVDALQRALLAQGVDGVIAAALVKETAGRLAHGTPLGAALAGTLGVPAAEERAARVRFVVGPPGDGKTTTIVKLAAQARRAGQRVALVGTDTYRVGAAAELEAYGRALGVPVALAPDAAGLARAFAGVRDADLVLVDTAGAAPGQSAALADLAALAEAAGADASRLLVASAATASRAAEQVWQTFAPLRPDACVLTKCDLAPGGPMLGLLWGRRVPVTHVAAGRRIPDDLEPATPDRLARCLLAA